MTVAERLHRVLRYVLGSNLEFDDLTSASDIEGWDSLAHVTLMFSVEHEFGVEFAGDEFARLESVGSLRRLLEEKLDSSSAHG
jgi:acyl carrier protein